MMKTVLISFLNTALRGWLAADVVSGLIERTLSGDGRVGAVNVRVDSSSAAVVLTVREGADFGALLSDVTRAVASAGVDVSNSQGFLTLLSGATRARGEGLGEDEESASVGDWLLTGVSAIFPPALIFSIPSGAVGRALGGAASTAGQVVGKVGGEAGVAAGKVAGGFVSGLLSNPAILIAGAGAILLLILFLKDKK